MFLNTIGAVYAFTWEISLNAMLYWANSDSSCMHCGFHEPSCVGPVVPLASGSALASAFASTLSSASLASSLALLELRDRSISALAPPISSRVTSKRLRGLLCSDRRNQRHETNISKAFKSKYWSPKSLPNCRNSNNVELRQGWRQKIGKLITVHNINILHSVHTIQIPAVKVLPASPLG